MLSIDSKKEAAILSDGYIASRGMVEIFIRDLRRILEDSELKFTIFDRFPYI